MLLRADDQNSQQFGMPVRLNLWLPEDLVDKLDAFRHTKRDPPTRAAALKELAEQRLAEIDLPPLPQETKPPKPRTRKRDKGKV